MRVVKVTRQQLTRLECKLAARWPAPRLASSPLASPVQRQRISGEVRGRRASATYLGAHENLERRTEVTRLLADVLLEREQVDQIFGRQRAALKQLADELGVQLWNKRDSQL